MNEWRMARRREGEEEKDICCERAERKAGVGVGGGTACARGIGQQRSAWCSPLRRQSPLHFSVQGRPPQPAGLPGAALLSGPAAGKTQCSCLCPQSSGCAMTGVGSGAEAAAAWGGGGAGTGIPAAPAARCGSQGSALVARAHGHGHGHGQGQGAGAGTGCATVRASHLPSFNGEVPCPPRTARRVTLCPFLTRTHYTTLPNVSKAYDWCACVPCACWAREAQGKWGGRKQKDPCTSMPPTAHPTPNPPWSTVGVGAGAGAGAGACACEAGNALSGNTPPLFIIIEQDISASEVPSSALGRLISRGHLQSAAREGGPRPVRSKLLQSTPPRIGKAKTREGQAKLADPRAFLVARCQETHAGSIEKRNGGQGTKEEKGRKKRQWPVSATVS